MTLAIFIMVLYIQVDPSCPSGISQLKEQIKLFKLRSFLGTSIFIESRNPLTLDLIPSKPFKTA